MSLSFGFAQDVITSTLDKPIYPKFNLNKPACRYFKAAMRLRNSLRPTSSPTCVRKVRFAI